MKLLTIRISDELHKELKLHCTRRGISMSKLVTDYLYDSLNFRNSVAAEQNLGNIVVINTNDDVEEIRKRI